MSKPQKIFVGLSGGVDSSVAALLLKQQGYDVVGVFLRCMNLDGCADADAEDARKVAEHIGIPFYSWDFEERYRDAVVHPLIDGYREGTTPNPDVACNKEIKFGAFLEAARSLGGGAVATGHYARTVEEDGVMYLAQAADQEKDQTYFLCMLEEEVLRRAYFPLADLQKSEVRRIATEARLPTAAKKDSQGICFLGKVSLSDYLRTQLPIEQGKLLNAAGEEIGNHDGAWFYTVGQRSGFYITGSRGSVATPAYYVAARDVRANTVTVVEHDDKLLFMRSVRLTNIVTHTPVMQATLQGTAVLARTRYRQELAPAMLKREGENWLLTFDGVHSIAAPGQAAVCYDQAGRVLLGGIISEIL